MHPLERLVNLVALLRASRTPLTFQQIREQLPAYAQADVQSAKRMFERDKDSLRAAGVPLDVKAVDAWETEHGYAIRDDQYYLPEISFTEEEASALVVLAATPMAADEETAWGVRKLLVGAMGAPFAGPGPSIPAVVDEAGDPNTTAIADAIAHRRSVNFTYKSATGAKSQRKLDPYGLVWRSGHMYAVGLDGDREEIRAFRVSRMASTPAESGDASLPPEGFRPRDHVTPQRSASARAVVAFSTSVGWWAAGQIMGAKVERTRNDGWVEVSVPLPADDWLVSWVLSFGADAEVLDPDSLREAVRRNLEETLGRL